MADNINDGGPAFPVPDGEAANLGYHGASLRDWFACHAPITLDQAWLTWTDPMTHPLETIAEGKERNGFFAWFSALRYEYADAMLNARENRNG